MIKLPRFPGRRKEQPRPNRELEAAALEQMHLRAASDARTEMQIRALMSDWFEVNVTRHPNFWTITGRYLPGDDDAHGGSRADGVSLAQTLCANAYDKVQLREAIANEESAANEAGAEQSAPTLEPEEAERQADAPIFAGEMRDARQYTGAMVDTRLNDLSRAIDEALNIRTEAAREAMRGFDEQRYNGLVMMGLINDDTIPVAREMKERAARFFPARHRVQELERFAGELKRSLALFPPDQLDSFDVDKAEWP